METAARRLAPKFRFTTTSESGPFRVDSSVSLGTGSSRSAEPVRNLDRATAILVAEQYLNLGRKNVTVGLDTF